MMFSRFAGLAILYLAGVEAGVARTWVIGEGYPLTISRMDPIVSPGKVAGHTHHVIGGSAFNPLLNDPDTQLKSTCTTVRVTEDKSNYWVPAVYWINRNGTYSLLPHITKVYYSMRDGDKKYAAFPPGMRMISGIATHRDPGNIRTQGIELNMNPYMTEDNPYNNMYIPNGTWHPNPPKNGYIHLNIRFPNCGWANQSLDSPDHFSHMTWPLFGGKWGPGSSVCPESHPIQYPQIFLENFVFITQRMKSEWNKNGPNFILANGDVTGLTFHADFVNGWNTTVLQNALDTCGDLGDGIEKCAAFTPYVQPNQVAWKSPCRIQSQIPAEDPGYVTPLQYLPGCNPRWDYDGPIKKPTNCPWFKGEPGWASPNLMWQDGAGMEAPAAIPGLNEADALKWSLYGGRDADTGSRAKFMRWNYDADGVNPVGGIMYGSQAEVNAAATSNGQNAKVYGLDIKTSYTQISPSKKLTAAELAAYSAHVETSQPQTYNCRYTTPDMNPIRCPLDNATLIELYGHA